MVPYYWTNFPFYISLEKHELSQIWSSLTYFVSSALYSLNKIVYLLLIFIMGSKENIKFCVAYSLRELFFIFAGRAGGTLSFLILRLSWKDFQSSHRENDILTKTFCHELLIQLEHNCSEFTQSHPTGETGNQGEPDVHGSRGPRHDPLTCWTCWLCSHALLLPGEHTRRALSSVVRSLLFPSFSDGLSAKCGRCGTHSLGSVSAKWGLHCVL